MRRVTIEVIISDDNIRAWNHEKGVQIINGMPEAALITSVRSDLSEWFPDNIPDWNEDEVWLRMWTDTVHTIEEGASL